MVGVRLADILLDASGQKHSIKLSTKILRCFYAAIATENSVISSYHLRVISEMVYATVF